MIAFKAVREDGEEFRSWCAPPEWEVRYRMGEECRPTVPNTLLFCVHEEIYCRESFPLTTVLRCEVPDDSTVIALHACGDRARWSENWRRVREDGLGALVGVPCRIVDEVNFIRAVETDPFHYRSLHKVLSILAEWVRPLEVCR